MATYRQTWTYFEDGYGLCRILFVIADTYDNLFETAGTVDCNVFSVGSVKQDLNLSKGTLAADELQVSVDEASIETTDDADAVQFFREAQDRTTPRYVALFVNTPDLPSAPVVTDALFAGVFSPTMKANDLQHHGAMYSSAINAVREWDASASTFLDNAIEDVVFADLIDGNAPEDVTGIDAGWITTNVADRLGYHKSPGGDPYGAREARFDKLVNLNVALRKLADNLEQTLLDRGLGTFTIVIETTAFDVSFSPARFVAVPGGSGQTSRILRIYGADPDPAKQPFTIEPGDTVSCSLGEGVSDDASPWVHWRMFKPEGKTESAMSYRRCKTFTEFLYALAASFGMFVRFYSAPGNELRIKFISRQSLEQAEVFFRDAESGSLDLTSEVAEEGGQIYATTTLYTADGSEMRPQSWPETYQLDTVYYQNLEPTKSHLWVQAASGDKAIVSVGVSLKQYRTMEDAGHSDAMRATCIPHNIAYYIGSTREIDVSPDRIDKAALGITSAIYVKTLPINEDVNPPSTAIWLPVAAVNAKIEGVEQIFYSLSSYVNAITGRDTNYYESAYDLDVPYLNCFSLSNTGSSPSWKNLILGSKMVIEENSIPITFLVVGIERDVSSVSTKIKLHRKSRFAFTTPTGPSAMLSADVDTTGSSESGTDVGSDTLGYTYVADETIEAYEAVRAYYTGSEWRVRRMRSVSDDYDSMLGIALNSALTGDVVTIQNTGRIQSSSYSFTPGQAVVVRTSTLPTLNVTQSRLTRKSRTEDMIVDIGTADTPTSFVLDIFKQLIFRT